MTDQAVAGDRRVLRWLLLAVTVAGLIVDVYVHWHLAARFDTLKGTASPHVSQGQLFRLEAILALLAIVLLVARRRAGAIVALVVTAGGVAAVLLYRYVDPGGFGPIPDMYDPSWYAEKTISAIAEAVAAVAALGYLLLPAGSAGNSVHRSPE
jgi:hypothetical protein